MRECVAHTGVMEGQPLPDSGRRGQAKQWYSTQVTKHNGEMVSKTKKRRKCPEPVIAKKNHKRLKEGGCVSSG